MNKYYCDKMNCTYRLCKYHYINLPEFLNINIMYIVEDCSKYEGCKKRKPKIKAKRH